MYSLLKHHRALFKLEHHLPLLAGILVLSSLAYFPLSQGSILADIPEIIVPIGVSLGLAVYSARLFRTDYDPEQVREMATYGWAGTVLAVFGFVWFAEQIQRELAATVLLDEALTVVNVCSGIGILVGARVVHESGFEDQADDRDRLLVEGVWTGDPGSNPILTTIVTQLARVKGVEPLELTPLYEHTDPDVFARLRAQDDSEWQVLFYTDEYEVRVSGLGTVKIYDDSKPGSTYALSASKGEQW